ncbi:MAG: prepilin-type N-terminal cleavage/methylation domain-containing protein, partial [Hydrogenophaga sp.]|nr:prepilin-type N-terminal cleavage/methylation domain-containing protein [Hydrogenophaga sp.]
MNPSTAPSTNHARRQQGFSLVELAMVLLVVGLLAALFLPATSTMMDNNRRNETRTKLEALEAAMTRFVMTNQ